MQSSGSVIRRLARTAAILWAVPIISGSPTQGTAMMDVPSLFATAQKEGRVGKARKSKLVDARPATPGEVVVTTIAGEGQETQSKPAEPGDMVVRNRCESTGTEQYLVKAATFPERYEGPLEAEDAQGWQPYQPRGDTMLYVIVRDQDGSFRFEAPWGEPMVARPGDAIVRNPADAKDTYRVAQDAFTCTYEVIQEPESDK